MEGLGSHLNPIDTGTSASKVGTPSEEASGSGAHAAKAALRDFTIHEALAAFDEHLKNNHPKFDFPDQRGRFDGFTSVVRTALEKRLRLPNEDRNSQSDDLFRADGGSWTLYSPETPNGEPVRNKVVIAALELVHSRVESKVENEGSAAAQEPSPTSHTSPETEPRLPPSPTSEERARIGAARIAETLRLVQGNLDLPRVARVALAHSLALERNAYDPKSPELRDLFKEIDTRIGVELRGPKQQVAGEPIVVSLGPTKVRVNPSELIRDVPSNDEWVLGEDNRAALHTLIFERQTDKRAEAAEQIRAAFSGRAQKETSGQILKFQELFLLMAACAEGYAGVEALSLLAASRELFDVIQSRNFPAPVKEQAEVMRRHVVGFLAHHAQLDFLSLYEREKFVVALHRFAPEAIPGEVFKGWSRPETDEGLDHGGRAFALTALKLGLAETTRTLTREEIFGRALTPEGKIDIHHPLADLGLEVLTKLRSDTPSELFRQTLMEALEDGSERSRRVARSAIRGLGELSHRRVDSELLKEVGKTHVSLNRETQKAVERIEPRLQPAPEPSPDELFVGNGKSKGTPPRTAPATGDREEVGAKETSREHGSTGRGSRSPGSGAKGTSAHKPAQKGGQEGRYGPKHLTPAEIARLGADLDL